MKQEAFCNELAKIEKKLSAMARSVAELGAKLELLKAAAGNLEPLAVPIIPDAYSPSPLITVQPYLDALAKLRQLLEQQRTIRGKKMKPYTGAVAIHSDGGNFERRSLQLIAKGYDIGRALDEREAELRSWADGSCSWHPDTDAGQIQKVQEAVQGLTT